MSSERPKPHGNENPNQGRVRSFLKGVLRKPHELTPVHETGIPTSPDLSGDNNGVGSKHNVLAIARPPARPSKTPTSGEIGHTAPPPTREDINAANAGELAPRGITKTMIDAARNHPLGAGFAVTAALTAAAYAIPAVHEQVNNSVSGWWNSLGDSLRAPSFEERFPIVLSQDSFTPVTHEAQKKLWQNTKTVDLGNHTLTIGFPFDQATIDRSPNIRMNQEFNAILPPFIDAEKLKQEGVKNITTITGLSNGDQYRLIYDTDRYEASIITISVAGVRRGEGFNSYVPAYTTLLVLYKDKATGESRGVWQSIAGLLAKPLVETKAPPTDHSSVYEDGVPIQSGSPILELTTDLQDWDGDEKALLPGQRGQFAIRFGSEQKDPRTPIPLTGNFIRTSDGDIATQQ